MSASLISLLSLVLLFVVILIWASFVDNEGWKIISILVICLTGIFGLGMFATINTWKEKEESCNVYEVIKGRHASLICTDHGNIIVENYKSESINDSTEFYWILSINHYNYEFSRDINIRNKHVKNKN